MESPVVVDKPPEYHGNDERGNPFDEEEGSGTWSELAARHPDIAARLRQHPAAWQRKRRPSSQDTDDFGETFGSFDRFPFYDVPPEFREHFSPTWSRRFGSRDQPQPHSSQAPPASPPQTPAPAPGPAAPAATVSTSTQTELDAPQEAHNPLPQYGLRNTVDLGQKSPTDPSLVDAEERSQRSSSAPPPARNMSAAPEKPVVYVVPIQVESREPRAARRDDAAHFGEPAPPPPAARAFHDEPAYRAPPHFTRSMGGPPKARADFQRDVFPQSARAPSPAPAPPAPAPPAPAPPAPAEPPQAPPPPPRPDYDPIAQILSIQTEVLDLMADVEAFKGTKKEKRYAILDEMLTRNLIKLDNIETNGKEKIRTARKEAIRCIQKCIAVLEAKAEQNKAAAAGGDAAEPPAADQPPAAADPQLAADVQKAPEAGAVVSDKSNDSDKTEEKPDVEQMDVEDSPQNMDVDGSTLVTKI